MLFICIITGLIQIANADTTCLKATGVSGGEYHTLAAMENGTVWACGGNGSGQLGIGKTTVGNPWLIQVVGGQIETANLEGITQIDAGWEHSLALDEDGYVWAWGSDASGQLGNGTDSGSSSYPIQALGSDPNAVSNPNDPNEIAVLENIIFISAGRSGLHSLACDSDGAVWAWGANTLGQCGNGTTTKQQRPVQVISGSGFLGDVSKIVEVDAGTSHSLALDEDGDVWTWGSGQLTAVKVSGLDSIDVVEISAGERSLARDSDGYVWKWGTRYNNTVVRVAGGEMGTTYLENIAAIGTGESHSLAMDEDGRVWAWGNNTSGTLGNNSNVYGYEPVAVWCGEMQTASGLLETITSLDAGWTHSLAVDEQGEIWAWGSGGNGKLGTGIIQNEHVPVRMECASSDDTATSVSIDWSGDPDSCVCPESSDPNLTYTISYTVDAADVATAIMSIYLPKGVDFLAADPDCGVYDEELHSYYLMIDDTGQGASGTIDIDVRVNEWANPTDVLICRAYLDVAESFAEATEIIDVCCRGGQIIYVDPDAIEVTVEIGGLEYATGRNTGLSWDDAYRDLQMALTRAGNSCGSVIWVAKGKYCPTLDASATAASFELVEGVGMFGGFEGAGVYETSLDQRVFGDDPNEGSVLSGDINRNGQPDMLNTVTATGVINAAFDGFTITNSTEAGIYLDNANPAITRCVLTGNDQYAINAGNFSEPEIANCLFSNNLTSDIYSNLSEITVGETVFDGTYITTTAIDAADSNINIANSTIKAYTAAGITRDDTNLTMADSVVEYNGTDGISSIDGADTTITNSFIRNNGNNGVYTEYGQDTQIKGSVIYGNGLDDDTAVGIFLNYPIATADIYNNTILSNAGGGIYQVSGVDQDIRNCIVYYNGDSTDDNLVKNTGTFGDVSYSCVEGGFAGDYNISTAPEFYSSTDPDEFHLTDSSDCVNAGDPNMSYSEQVDLDGEDRVKDGRVDIGADEYYWSAADLNSDEFVNFIDFAILADDNTTDEDDIIAFAEDWLWEAGWNIMTTAGAQSAMMGMMSAPESVSLSSSMSIAIEPVEIETQAAAKTITSGPIILTAVTQKTKDLYEIRAEKSDRPNIKKLPTKLIDTETMLQLLDEIWEEGEISDSVSKKTWQEFIDSIKQQ